MLAFNSVILCSDCSSDIDLPVHCSLENQTGMDLLLDLSSDLNEDKELQAASLLLMALSFVSKASTSSCLFKAINS
jgi:hypothetical protein